MFEGSVNALEKSLLIMSDLKLTVTLSNCFVNLVMLKGANLTTLDTDGLIIYRAGTTLALAMKAFCHAGA